MKRCKQSEMISNIVPYNVTLLLITTNQSTKLTSYLHLQWKKLAVEAQFEFIF